KVPKELLVEHLRIGAALISLRACGPQRGGAHPELHIREHGGKELPEGQGRRQRRERLRARAGVGCRRPARTRDEEQEKQAAHPHAAQGSRARSSISAAPRSSEMTAMAAAPVFRTAHARSRVIPPMPTTGRDAACTASARPASPCTGSGFLLL